jgi:type I restriction enzyme S subunit
MADIRRRARQSINQTNVNPEEVKEIKIPILDMEFQQEVATRLQSANQKRIIAQNLYSSAENYLLECLGMQDFVANPDAYNIKTLKESFLESGRIDAEYYLPKYEELTSFIQNYSLGCSQLSDIVDFYRGSLIADTYYTDYDTTRPAYIRGGDISSNRIVADNMVSISSEFIPSEETTCIEGDIIMAMIGSVGTASIVSQDFSGSYISNNLGLLRLRNPSIRAEVLHLYLTSPIGKMFFTQRQMVTAQPKIAFRDIENIPIPLIRPEIQAEIAQHIQRSFALRKEALKLLEEAKLSVEQAIGVGGGKLLIYSDLQRRSEQEERLAMYLLLKDLGLLAEKSPRTKIVATEKKLSASFFASGRLDAEYYQPKYDYLDSQLAQLPTQRLGEIVGIQKSIEPGSEAYQTEGIPFVRVSDFNKFGLETPSVCLDRATYATALRPQKDTILLSKDGSVGIAYKVENDTDVITSGAILHLLVKAKGVLPDYLTLVLNSPIVKMQAERDAGGSIIQHWKPSEIEQVVIPILSSDIQQKLSERVSKSFALRREANALLAEAKAMVERAIEAIA